MNGIIILDKPSGFSSNQSMGQIKHLLGRPKMGFLGTLDPLATGVLPLFVGKATKLIPLFESTTKEYVVKIKLGETTDTLDSEGTIQTVSDTQSLQPDQVREAILSFEGQQIQRTPSFSAIKINGVPAYKLARKEIEVPERPRTVEVFNITVDLMALPSVVFRVSCSAGTYMRSLAEAIGEKTKVGAHVTGLRRTKCGRLFTEENSFSVEKIRCEVRANTMGFLRKPGDFLTDFMPIVVTEAMEARLRNGQPVTTTACKTETNSVKFLRQDGELLAIGEIVQNGDEKIVVQPKTVLI